MPQFRNLFPKRPTVHVEPATDGGQESLGDDTRKERQRPSLNIRRSRDGPPNEYKMSVVSDNGVYLPPSPTEKKSYWHRSSSRNNSRSRLDDNEPFSISRESFDSYRRSFDISARSPVSQSDTAASRTSLDSRLSRATPRSTVNNGTLEPPKAADEERFEEVTLNEDTKPKKRSFFARFADSPAEAPSLPDNSKPSSSHHGFHIPGRRRGQSGQGAELGNIVKEN